jgi:hypothetical protein
MNDKTDDRKVFIWRGRDRKEDIGLFADAIVASGVELFNHSGDLFQLDGATGKLVRVSQNAFRDLVDKHLCGERVVRNGTGWVREKFTYPFAPKPPRAAPTRANPNPDAGSELVPDAPDDKALVEVFEELPSRLPRVVE